jgi:SAM-dependent methyltransferase
MNFAHDRLCSSSWWARRVGDKLLPWGLQDVELGGEVLEVGPGFGATTRLLAGRGCKLTVVELEERYCERLRRDLGPSVNVLQGDATRLPCEDGRFSAVVCFTMLHHIPVRADQDRAFAEFARVLAPGGVFAGTDSVGVGALFRLIHIGDALLPIDPDELPQRLEAAGLGEPRVERVNGSFRFRAWKPGRSGPAPMQEPASEGATGL